MGSAVAFIIASGPSLTQADVDMVRGMGTVYAVNNAVFMATFADVHYACDEQWWKAYCPTRPDWFTGERLTISPYNYRFDAVRIPSEYSGTFGDGFGKAAVRTGGNSGFQCLNLAIIRGHKTICLLGFDHKHTGGKAHFHGDHPKGIGNAGGCDVWIRAMNKAALNTHGAKVINCTRDTALECFERMPLENFIREYCTATGVY